MSWHRFSRTLGETSVCGSCGAVYRTGTTHRCKRRIAARAMTWLRDFPVMRRARFTRAERRAFRGTDDVPGYALDSRQMSLLMRYDAARGPS
jgi:hypothetical protein